MHALTDAYKHALKTDGLDERIRRFVFKMLVISVSAKSTQTRWCNVLWCWHIRQLSFLPAGQSWWKIPKVIRNFDYVINRPESKASRWCLVICQICCFKQNLAGWLELVMFIYIVQYHIQRVNEHYNPSSRSPRGWGEKNLIRLTFDGHAHGAWTCASS